jgi:hypothetical protein
MQYYYLKITCITASELRCSAVYYPGGTDVTAQAQWSAADSFTLAMDTLLTPSSAVTFKTPGVATALVAANVWIRADYVISYGAPIRNIEPHAFAVAPGRAAVPLAYLSGTVSNGGVPGSGPVGDATVEIIAGAGAGRRTTTLSSNGAYWFDFMPMNTPFTVMASKAGFNSDTRTHAGIADDASGYPSNSYLHFALVAK